jgi:hypothetical protein
MVDRLTVQGAMLAEDLFLAIRQRFTEPNLSPQTSSQPAESGASR